jgi:hypothetical protein
LPVGAKPVTEAVKVTLAPCDAGLAELARIVLLAALFTTCDNALLPEAPLFASPLYAAVMLWVPVPSALVAQAAVRAFPLPASATAEQPATELAPSLKLTVPVGELAFTVAVNVTVLPTTEGVSEVARLVVLDELLTTCDKTLLVEALLLASPVYAAVMLWVPTVSVLVAHVAVRTLPLPASATAEQPASELAPSLKLTVPVGE